MNDPVVYLDTDDILTAGGVALGAQPLVRDFGLLESAALRPQTTVFGRDAYDGIYVKAAALLHSLASNHSLVDGNKRTAWASAAVFLGVNGYPLHDDFDEDKAEAMVLAASQSHISLEEIAGVLEEFTL